MRSLPLGPTDTISEIMLGTMTFGTQTEEPDAHRQMDVAASAGVTWLDTAEMYPVNPVRAETIGRTEEIVGRWLAAGGAGRLRVATKHIGQGGFGDAITAESIPRAIESSLGRLQIGHIDLYQLHWPNRGSYHFRQSWSYEPSGDRAAILQDLADCIGALEREVERGTIRAFGLSNETTWGLSHWLQLSQDGPARPISVQNEYSLLCRLADTDLAELLHHDQVTMLAYSPLAAGLLTGKYQDGALPEGSRRSINGGLGGRWTDRVEGAVGAYLDLAQAHGMDPVHMALCWLQSRPFACSAIVGATTAAQLQHALGAAGMTLTDELIDAIDAVHRAHPMPF